MKSKDEKYEKIKEMKIKLPLEKLCNELPKEFKEYIEYVRNLDFTAEPDYKKLNFYIC